MPLPEWVPPVHGFWGEAVDGGLAHSDWGSRYDFLSYLSPRCVVTRLLACAFARGVLHLLEADRPPSSHPRSIIGKAERFAFGLVGEAELRAARDSVFDLTVRGRSSYIGQASYAIYCVATTELVSPCHVSTVAVAALLVHDARLTVHGVIDGLDDAAARAARLDQARILTMFQPYPWSEQARAIGRKWVDTYWTSGDDWLTRAICADACEEDGMPSDHPVLRAMRELPVGQYLLGYGPMVPS